MSELGLDFELGEMADTIRDTTRRFAKERIEPIAAKIDEEDWFPKELWPEMGALGADCQAPSAPHWCHCWSEEDCTHVRAGTEWPSVADEHHGQEAVQLVGLVVVPAVKVPSLWHCRQMASEELCTHTPTATFASTVPV